MRVMQRLPDPGAAAIIRQERIRKSISEARASLKDSSRLVARAALDAGVSQRVMQVFAEAVEMTDEYLARALDDLAQPERQT